MSPFRAAESALAGRRVVVTRAREQSADLVDALAARGAHVVPFAAIAIEPANDRDVLGAILELETYAWIAFTSVNAVRCFWRALRDAGRAGLPATLRVAAVGSATAAALVERAATVAAIPERFRGAELAAAMGPLEGRRVLLPGSEIAREETGEALRAAGALVDQVVVYRTVTAKPDAAALAALDEDVDAVTFTSPSTVRGFLEAGGAAAQRVLRRAVIACIGPTTGDAVRALGVRVAVQPERHTAAALVEALESHFAAAPAASPGGS